MMYVWQYFVNENENQEIQNWSQKTTLFPSNLSLQNSCKTDHDTFNINQTHAVVELLLSHIERY